MVYIFGHMNLIINELIIYGSMNWENGASLANAMVHAMKATCSLY